MMFPTFRTLAVALFIATVVAIAPSAPTMAQTNAQPQKLTGSAGLLAEGWSTEAKEADAYFDNYRFRNGKRSRACTCTMPPLARSTATRRATPTMPSLFSIGPMRAVDRSSLPII